LFIFFIFRTLFDLCGELIDIASDKILFDDLKFSFMFIMFLLLVDDESIPIL